MTVVRRFPPRTVGLAAAVAVGYFVDSAVFLLLLLSSSSHGVGWWVTALWTGRRTYRAGAVGSVVLGGLLVSLALLVEGLVPSAVIIGLVFMVGGFGNAIHNVGVRNLVYEQVPRALQAQVWAVVGATFSGAAAVGNFLGTPGLLLPAQEVVVLSGALGVAFVAATVILLLVHGHRGAPGGP